MYFKTIEMNIPKVFLIFPIVFYPTFILNSFVRHTHASPITLAAWLFGAVFLFPQIFRKLIFIELRNGAELARLRNKENKVDSILVLLFAILSFIGSMFWPAVFIGLGVWQFLINPVLNKYMESIKEDFAVENALKKGSER